MDVHKFSTEELAMNYCEQFLSNQNLKLFAKTIYRKSQKIIENQINE